jgi:hypothetical protein
MHAGDKRSGRGAWLLHNIEKLQVYGVHSLLWHEIKRVYKAPLVDQVARALKVTSQLQPEEMQRLGGEASLIDVLGIKDREIWLVQTVWESRLVDSATNDRQLGATVLFKSRVFNEPVFKGDSLATLFKAEYVMGKAFPDNGVRTLCLVLHPEKPDFELYDVPMPKNRPDSIILTADRLRTSSLNFEQRIQEDHEALWRLPARLDDDLFRGLPPCRGGRTLAMLASMAKQQLASQQLLRWKEQDFIRRMMEDFDYDIPRDKIRHDLVDRLVGQGFMRKWGNVYCLTVKGIARYLYSLAKYTTRAVEDPAAVLDACIAHRNRMIQSGCL